jgi:hypothetical protein
MTSDLNDQVRAYTNYFVEGTDPVDLNEIVGRDLSALVSRPRVRRVVPRWAVGLAAALVVMLVVGGTALGIWLFGGSSDREVVQPGPSSITLPGATTPELRWCFNRDCVEPVESGEVIRVSTLLGEMEWQRLVGQEFEAEFEALNRSLAVSARPFGGEGADWRSFAWPPAGWEIEDRIYRDPAGLPGLEVGVVDASGVWEPLEVEADVTWVHGVERPIQGYWLVAGPAGVMLVGEPFNADHPGPNSAVAPVGWVQSDEERFELVGSLPFRPDFVSLGVDSDSVGWPNGVPTILPVADGFVGIGHQPGSDMGEVSQELWWSEDGRTWTQINERPFGEDSWIGPVAGYGGQWIGLQLGGESNWVWASTDGRVWDRVGEFPVVDCWGSPALLGGERGWIAVDCDFSNVWLSVDGSEWQQLPNQDTILGIYPSIDEVSLGMSVSLIGNDRTVLISAGPWWDTSVGWVGRFVEDPPSG